MLAMSTVNADAPIGTPVYGIGFGAAAKRFFKGIFTFSGRASRGEFWWGYLVSAIIGIVVSTIIIVVATVETTAFITSYSTTYDPYAPSVAPVPIATIIVSIVGVIATLPLTIATLAVGARRLRDAGFTPLLLLLSLAGLGIVWIVMCALPTKDASAGYGGGYGQPQSYGQTQSYGQAPGYGQPQGYGQTPPASQPPQGGWGPQ